MRGGVGWVDGRMLNVLHGKSTTWPDLQSANVCVPYSVWLWPRPGGVLHEEWGVSVHTGLPTHARHPLQWLWGLCGGGSGHCFGQDLPPCLLRLHHLQVRLIHFTLADKKLPRSYFFALHLAFQYSIQYWYNTIQSDICEVTHNQSPRWQEFQ